MVRTRRAAVTWRLDRTSAAVVASGQRARAAAPSNLTTVDTPGGISLDDELRHWPADEETARATQDRLRAHLRLDEPGPAPGEGTVVGVDVAYDDDRGVVAAAAVALDARTRTVVDRATAVGSVSFPYVPGLLAFREIPTVLTALDRLCRIPDLVVCDGYGLAHPRRFGLACHLGVLTGLPTIGVAKNPFAFRYALPGPGRGATSPLLADHRATGRPDASTAGAEDGEVVGYALRTRSGVKPVFVSVGHRVSLDQARRHTLHLTPAYRLPETTRTADTLCRQALARA